MDVIYPRCCGLDVHKRTVVACLVTPGAGRAVRKEVRTFGTTTDELRALAGWLAAAGCTHAALESTAVYWHPVVRHEALLNREGMEGPLRRAVAAARRS